MFDHTKFQMTGLPFKIKDYYPTRATRSSASLIHQTYWIPTNLQITINHLRKMSVTYKY